MTDSLRATALAAQAAGIAVLPPREDGSKRPIGDSWEQYQRASATRQQVEAWYPPNCKRTGIGYVTGPVSGNLEMLEWEEQATYRAFKDAADRAGLSALVERIEAGYLEQTPGGGFHWLYRCPTIAGNTKLARRPKRPDEQRDARDRIAVLIETRGTGGYTVAAPSNGRVHPTGGAYRLLRGGVSTIVTITPDERESLFDLARSLDQMPRSTVQPPASVSRNDARPGDDFNARATWEDVLEPHGWHMVFTREDVTYWRRPGKDTGISATTNFGGSDLLYVFSTATAFDAERAYDKFAAYAVLDHGGDFPAAARTLAQQGYGTPGHAVAERERTPPAEETPWPPREPLPSAPSVPALPPALVPAPFGPWLTDTAGRACVPLEFIAVPAIVAAGAVIGRGCGIRPWRFDDYLVVPNLWGADIGRPGVMKTYCIDEGTAPLNRLAAAAARAFEQASAEREAHAERLEAELAAITDAMRQRAKAERTGKPAKGVQHGDADSFDTLEAALVAKKAELAAAAAPARRYVTQDATVEKLGELLRDNPRGLLIKRDEITGWLRTLDKPGREGEREFFLEGWNGTGEYTFDRIGRGTVRIEGVTLSIIGGIQPGKLQSYINDAVDGGSGADGMLQRFQLMVWPDDPGPWEPPTHWPDRQARNAAFAIFEKLDDLPALLGDTVQRDGEGIPYLRFAPDAQVLADAWRTTLENRLRSAELAKTPAFESHLAKFRSLMPSLALVFHLIDIAAGAMPGTVSLNAARRAAAWCDFLEAHARRVYATELRPGVEAAQALATKITQGLVKDGATVRDLYAKHHWQGLSNAAAMSAALDVLTAAKWVRVEQVDTGGRPSEIVRLHPELREAAGV